MKHFLIKILSIILCLNLIYCATKPSQYQTIENLPALSLLDVVSNTPDKIPPIIGLYRKLEGKKQFFCSASVISDKLAITAAHCLVDEDYFMIKDNIEISDINLNPTNLIVKAGAVNIRADVGLVVGDFSRFNKLAIKLYPGGIFNVKGPFVTCGFAWGSAPLLCTPFIPMQNYYFEEQGKGRLYPGMSGGPVIDTDSGMLIGINTEVGAPGVMFASTVGLLGALELKLEAEIK